MTTEETEFKQGDKVRLKTDAVDETFEWVERASAEGWVGVIVALAVYPDDQEYTVHFDVEHGLTFCADELELVAPAADPRDAEIARLTAALAEAQAMIELLRPSAIIEALRAGNFTTIPSDEQADDAAGEG